jgi:twitching motility two-component system response regulator PilH
MPVATILIIDDSRFTRSNIAKSLRNSSYEVLEADNGVAGLDMIIKHTPDFVITDLLMPEMDGFELLENLRSRGIAVPVIVMSADIQETTRRRIMELGAKTLLNKPFQSTTLLDTLRNLTASENEKK